MAAKRGLPQRKKMRHDRHFVDELASRSGEGIGKVVPIDLISSNQDQPRSMLGDVSDLVKSITRHGVLEPLLVRRQDDGRYELVSGERRFRASLEAGLEEVPCIELTVTDQYALEIALIENLQRKDLSAFEEAEGFTTLIAKYGYTHEQVAEAVGRSRVTVTETLKLLELPAEIRDQCRHADITAKGLLLEIAKAPDVGAMRQLVDELASGEIVDRRGLRIRRKQLAGELPEQPQEEPGDTEGEDESDAKGSEEAPAESPRPYVVRFQAPDKKVKVSLSFRSENEPSPDEIIKVLEDLIAQIKSGDDDTAS